MPSNPNPNSKPYWFLTEWRLLGFGLLMTFWSSPGQTFFISLFSGEIRSEIGLSHGQFGALYSAATLASAVAIIWSGALVDRIDLRKFSAAVIMILAAGCWLLSISNSAATLLLCLFLLRHGGQGLMFICSTTAMVRYLETVKGKASAISGMGYPLGEAIFPSIVVLMISIFSWRDSWKIYAITLIAIVIPLVLFMLKGQQVRHRTFLKNTSQQNLEDNEPQKQRQWKRSEVLRDLKFYLILPGLLSQPLMFTGFIFHQVHLVESKGWALSMWGSLFLVYALVSVIFNIVCGVLIDRYGAYKILPFYPLPMALGLMAMSFSSTELTALFFLVMTGITVGFSSPLATPLFVELYGSRHIGAIKSLSTSMMVLFSAISPVILGAFFDIGVSLETLTLGGAIYIFLTSGLAYWTCKRYITPHRALSV